MKNFLVLAVLVCAVLQFSGQNVPDPSSTPDNPQTTAVTCSDPCPWDFDDSGFISGGEDLLQFLASYGLYTNQSCEVGDFNEDMLVDIQDLRIMLPRLGTECQD